MSDFTYEFNNRSQSLEKFEWDNVWWEQADVTGVPRVLYIGDSISCATRRVATAAAEGKIFFDGFGTSKAVDNPYFSESVRLFAQQQGERELIIFNNGLHGWHLDDDTEYIQYYEQLVKFLLSEFGATPIVLILTTAIADEKRNARVIKRNNAVVKLAAAYNLSVVDLYSVVNEHRELLSPDGVHLIPEGYKLLASALLSHINGLIK
jgi:lysophospholipase L1-like esterase